MFHARGERQRSRLDCRRGGVPQAPTTEVHFRVRPYNDTLHYLSLSLILQHILRLLLLAFLILHLKAQLVITRYASMRGLFFFSRRHFLLHILSIHSLVSLFVSFASHHLLRITLCVWFIGFRLLPLN